MRWYFASLVLLVSLAFVAIVSYKGGESMSLLPDGSEAGLARPSSDLHSAGTFETATFALG
jgi:hypothetical protein